MPSPASRFSSRTSIHLLVITSGFAALSWEVIWQIKSSLALGVSAWGTAITLAVTMGGMCIGAFVMGHALRDKTIARPARIYGVLEVVIGLAGLCLAAAFRIIEKIDTKTYAEMPGNAPWVYIIGIIAVLGVPAICMGASLPVFGLVARQFKTSIAVLYALNTLGAALGCLLAAFCLIPLFGVTRTGCIIAAVNIVVGIATWNLGPGTPAISRARNISKHASKFGSITSYAIVIVTGFATFALEIAWFRSLTAAFHSTTDAFAIMLASVLIALGVGARLVPALKHRKISLGTLVSWAGILILLITPVIERFDILTNMQPYHLQAILVILNWFMMTLYAIGPAVLFLGVAFPWILDNQNVPRRWGGLYAANTLAAIAGSIGAAWLLLPTIGFARTAWLAGVLVAVTGIAIAPRQKRMMLGGIGIAALLVAIVFESGVGHTRTQGWLVYSSSRPSKVLQFFEGPESSVSAIEYDNGGRVLVVDGFVAAGQLGADSESHFHYMAWMGHLPMLLHPHPKNALVICFGTGQTANAVRNENPESLDIVDINPRVFKLAHNFPANQNVLSDPRVKQIVMDGRAYIRRTNKVYDVITLEPMRPNFAGVTALYSREFYQFARERLSADGVIAQWLPLHLVAPEYSTSIAKTFRDVFPNAILWIDPLSKTAILIGTKNDKATLGNTWPGFKRAGSGRDLSEKDVRNAILLNSKQLERFASYGKEISDDNQLLAYGKAVYPAIDFEDLMKENFELLDRVR